LALNFSSPDLNAITWTTKSSATYRSANDAAHWTASSAESDLSVPTITRRTAPFSICLFIRSFCLLGEAESLTHTARAVRFLEELEDYMSEDYAERTLKSVVNWGRYGELFAYDETSDTFSLENPQ
jgi:hypothetical protein